MNVHVITTITYKIMNTSHIIVIITKTKINNNLLISRPELYYVIHLLVLPFHPLLKM